MAKYQVAVSEEESTKIRAAEASSINVGAVISVFGIQLIGTVEKEGDGTRIFVCPSTENPKQSVKLDSICGSVGFTEAQKKTIGEIIKYLGFNGGIEKTEIDVYQAFFYYSSHDKDKAEYEKKDNKEDDKKDNEKKDEKIVLNQEYAFSLGITNTYKPEPDETIPFGIESISFSIWNSTRKKVTESLGIYSISDMLKNFSE